MNSKRVLLVDSGQIIGEVIHNLFAQEEHLIISDIDPDDPSTLLRAVYDHHPDVIVMDDSQQEKYLNYLLCYLRNSPDLRILVVKSNSNRVELYQKTQVPVLKTADLFAIL